MKILKQGVCLALLGAGLAAVPGMQASATDTSSRVAGESLVQQMRSAAQGSVTLSSERATGKVSFVRSSGQGDLMPSREGGSATAAAAKATAYLQQFGGAFGAGAGELREFGVHASTYGWTVTFKQSYQGVPVFGGTLKANVDKAGDLTSVSGFAAPGLSLSTTPRFSASEAAAKAIASVRSDPPGEGRTDTSGLKAADNDLMVYRMGAVKGDAGKAVLVHAIEVTNLRNIRDMVFVDAHTNKLVNRYSMTHGLETDRELYEESAEPDNLVWKEGDPFPGALNADQQNLVNASGDSYWFFANTFGRDSYDAAGATMKTVNNDPTIQCPNANWNGVTTNYCDGVTSDDVVAHEWGHAYTEYTANLIYQYQPGALNESYSDVWGETIDLINGRDDEGEGDLTTPRPVGQCSTHSPATPLLSINSPAAIARDCATGGASFGPQLDGTGITGEVAMGLDADEDGDNDPNPFDLEGSVYDGCSAFTNPADLVGKIVMVNRGLCGFEVKARNIDAAGGVAAIIGNRNPGEVFTMSGDEDPDPTIPTVMIDSENRNAIAGVLEGSSGDPVNVTMKDASGDRVDSFRWLVSEKSDAFGGAIRDMWAPTCYGDPGKVSDAEYKCSSDDSGGVHGNSGIPNHAYALTVDGGTFNGVTVTGIGLDKAAAIWWRTLDGYLTETSDFVDMADGLGAACADLVGQPVLSLETEPNTPGTPGDIMTAADCTEVANAAEAVELRLDPTEQCDWQPLLKKGAPRACGKGTEARTVWKENFRDGLKGWKKTQEVVFPGAHGIEWKATRNAPKHRGRTAYAPDPSDLGSCDGSADDLSSRNSIISPKVRMPNRGKAAKLIFDHYVATEIGYDGGNVKISVNGKKFKLIPESAFIFNGYNATMEAAEVGGVPNNTSPLAGQPGFTGTDGGSAFGSWGQSQVNLVKLNVDQGDRLKIRFDFGRDGCGGNDGWYVDDVKVVICKKKDDNRGRELATRQ